MGRIRDIKITEDCTLTHLLFVDDVLILLNGGIGDTSAFHRSLGIFLKATVMVLNEAKSTISATSCSQHEIQSILKIFAFAEVQLEEGLRYLGYRLKPLGYKIADWTWLIAKVEKRLNI